MNPSSNHANQVTPYLTLQSNEGLKFAKFLMNQLTDAVFWFRRDAQFFYVNDTTCRWLGYSREELLCLKIHDIDLELPVETWSEWWRSLRHQGHLTFKSQYRTKAGEKLPMEIAFSYYSCQDKEFGCAFARDHTAEVELCQALEQERKYSQRRAEFNSILSHEIRNTPKITRSVIAPHFQIGAETRR